MVNLSGVKPSTSISKWHPATTLNVTWQVTPRALDKAIAFSVFRSDVAHRFVPDGKATMASGEVSVVLRPGELVTLVGQ